MTYNKNRMICLALSVIGIIDSLYLTWVKFSQSQIACIKGLGDCGSVNSSRYSELFGIPVALLGAITYLTLFAVFILEGKIALLKDNGATIVFGISLFGVIYSLYLTYIEVAVINAICPFCVLSALTMTLILVFSIIRLLPGQAN
jgi:uncharacterized membrane protein